jgi:hypothetical protein
MTTRFRKADGQRTTGDRQDGRDNVRAMIVYFSVTGRNGQIAKALDQALRENGYAPERFFLEPTRKLGVAGAIATAVLARTVELTGMPDLTGSDLVAIVGPVWASRVNPPVRAFLNALPDLGGKTVINIVGGYNPHENVVKEIDRELRQRNAGLVVSSAVRMRDVDTPEKTIIIARDIVARISEKPDS